MIDAGPHSRSLYRERAILHRFPAVPSARPLHVGWRWLGKPITHRRSQRTGSVPVQWLSIPSTDASSGSISPLRSPPLHPNRPSAPAPRITIAWRTIRSDVSFESHGTARRSPFSAPRLMACPYRSCWPRLNSKPSRSPAKSSSSSPRPLWRRSRRCTSACRRSLTAR